MNNPKPFAGKFAKAFPELGTKPLPIDKVYSPEAYEDQKEKIFKKMWLRFLAACEIPNVGDYVVKELECADTSLIVTHAADGKIRAFHNMCSHRSNRVAYEKKGNTKTFKCRFHAWTYGLDGALIHLPEPDLFPDFDQCDHGLTEVACEVWEGHVFINVDPEPQWTLEEYLGPEIYNGYGGYWAQFEMTCKFEVDVNCNWMAFQDAFVETYHFDTVHRASAGDLINTVENPNGHVDGVRLFDRHRIVSAGSNMEYVPIFPEAIARKYSGSATMAVDQEMMKEGSGLPPIVNPAGMADWVTDIMIIFPVCNLQAFQGMYLTKNYWPTAHDKTHWEFMVFQAPPSNAAEEIAVEYNRVYMRDVVREDLNNLEMIQSNLSSGAKKAQQLGDQEIMVRHNYKVIADHLGYGYDV